MRTDLPPQPCAIQFDDKQCVRQSPGSPKSPAGSSLAWAMASRGETLFFRSVWCITSLQSARGFNYGKWCFDVTIVVRACIAIVLTDIGYFVNDTEISRMIDETANGPGLENVHNTIFRLFGLLCTFVYCSGALLVSLYNCVFPFGDVLWNKKKDVIRLSTLFGFTIA